MNDVSVAPHVVRRGEGTPLVAIHGNGVDHRLLVALDDCLAASGAWERIYIDLPGFGGTPGLGGLGGLPEIADWLTGAVGDLVGERPFALVANSLGGLLARHVTRVYQQQVIGLALLAPVVDPVAAKRIRPEQRIVERDDVLINSLPADDRDEFTSVAVRQVRESWEAFRDHALPGIRAADVDAMNRLSERYFLLQEPESGCPPFEGPTLIVAGRQDHIVGFEDQYGLLGKYPNATYLAVGGAGHNVHLEQPELVEAAVRDWSQRVAMAASGGVNLEPVLRVKGASK